MIREKGVLNRDNNLRFKALGFFNRPIPIKGDYRTIDDVLKYLKQWLSSHIQVSDKKYTDCFNINGLE
ncbi:MAG: hypothetical protein ACUZ8I_08080 [Candidatus Scalindua sp.]